MYSTLNLKIRQIAYKFMDRIETDNYTDKTVTYGIVRKNLIMKKKNEESNENNGTK